MAIESQMLRIVALILCLYWDIRSKHFLKLVPQTHYKMVCRLIYIHLNNHKPLQSYSPKKREQHGTFKTPFLISWPAWHSQIGQHTGHSSNNPENLSSHKLTTTWKLVLNNSSNKHGRAWSLFRPIWCRTKYPTIRPAGFCIQSLLRSWL